MDLDEAYEKLKARKLAAGFEDRHGAQQVKKDVMRLVAIGLELDIDHLDEFARRFTRGLVTGHDAAVNYSGMMVMPPDTMSAIIVDMVLLGAYHHEQIEGGLGRD